MNNNDSDTWMPMKLYPPERFETLEVRLVNGSVMRAIWTGAKWWGNGQTLEPQAWRLPQKSEQRIAL